MVHRTFLAADFAAVAAAAALNGDPLPNNWKPHGDTLSAAVTSTGALQTYPCLSDFSVTSDMTPRVAAAGLFEPWWVLGSHFAALARTTCDHHETSKDGTDRTAITLSQNVGVSGWLRP